MRSILVLLLVLLLSSCYLATQGYYLLADQSYAKDINRLLRDKTLDPELRTFLENIQAIRASALQILALDNDKNYTKYIDTDRDFVVMVVSASRDNSLERYLWNYPIFGKLPYRGYYKENAARKEAQKLEQQDYDVLVRRVASYSSQGYFRAPIYSFMRNRPEASLAEIIFHELAHSRLWLKAHTQFNEEFATFVGRVGALHYIAEKYGPESAIYRDTGYKQQDAQTLYTLIRALREDLLTLYNKNMDRETTLIQKNRIIREFKKNFSQQYDELFYTPDYKNLPEYTINNAYINLFDTYTSSLPLFYEVYEHFDKDLKSTIQYITGIEEVFAKAKRESQQDPDPYQYLRSVLTARK